MGKAWLVCQRELKAYFRTWMGYIIAALSLLITGLLFNAFAIGDRPKFSAEVLGDYFYFASGLAMVAGLLLAMRLVAEEKQNGTLVLFFTSPISSRSWVYGKFLSALIFFVVLQALSLYLPGLVLLAGKISYGHLAAGYLALILLGMCGMAFGIFASSLAPNQLIAAVLGASLLCISLTLWMLADAVDEPLSSVFHYLALHERHFMPFSRGLIHLKDLVYYLSVIIFFLEATVRVIEARRLKSV